MRGLAILLLAGACASVPRSDYAPGGASLPASVRAEYRRAVSLEREGDLEEALRVLDDLSLRYPLSLGIHLHRLRLARKAVGPEAAAAFYEPPPPGVDMHRAEVLAALARLPEEDVAGRTAILESAAAREPGNAFWRLGLADVGVAAHDVVARRAEQEQALGQLAESARSTVEAGRLAEEARQDAETALQYDPQLAEAHVLLGFLWTRKGDLVPQREGRDEMRNAAEWHYREAIRIDPANLVARINLAENLLYFGRYSAADDQLDVALRLAPKEPLVWNNLGFAAYSTGRLDRAVECYREALRIEPDNARVRAALADALRRLDREDDAIRELEQARRDAGDDRRLLAEIAFKLGAIHEFAHRYGEAIREYELHISLGGADSAKAKSRIRRIYEGAFEE